MASILPAEQDSGSCDGWRATAVPDARVSHGQQRSATATGTASGVAQEAAGHTSCDLTALVKRMSPVRTRQRAQQEGPVQNGYPSRLERSAASSPRSRPRETSQVGAIANAAPMTTPSSDPIPRLPTTPTKPRPRPATPLCRGGLTSQTTAPTSHTPTTIVAGTDPTRRPNRSPRGTTSCLAVTFPPSPVVEYAWLGPPAVENLSGLTPPLELRAGHRAVSRRERTAV
jgi:hypothetical protein